MIRAPVSLSDVFLTQVREQLLPPLVTFSRAQQQQRFGSLQSRLCPLVLLCRNRLIRCQISSPAWHLMLTQSTKAATFLGCLMQREALKPPPRSRVLSSVSDKTKRGFYADAASSIPTSTIHCNSNQKTHTNTLPISQRSGSTLARGAHASEPRARTSHRAQPAAM
jgi:hypothetical protein